MKLQFALLTGLLAMAMQHKGCSSTTAQGSGVSINGQQLTEEQLAKFQQSSDAVIKPGNYWYDAVAGWYGCMGGDRVGNLLPGLSAAPLPSNASKGDSELFLNGRELTTEESNDVGEACYCVLLVDRFWVRPAGSSGTYYHYGREGETDMLGFIDYSKKNNSGGSSSGSTDTVDSSVGSSGSSSIGTSGGGCSSTSSRSVSCSGPQGFVDITPEGMSSGSWGSPDDGRRRQLRRLLDDGSRLPQGAPQQVITCDASAGASSTANPSMSTASQNTLTADKQTGMGKFKSSGGRRVVGRLLTQGALGVLALLLVAA